MGENKVQKFYFVFRRWENGTLEVYENSFPSREEAIKSAWWEEENAKVLGKKIIMIPIDPTTI